MQKPAENCYLPWKKLKYAQNLTKTSVTLTLVVKGLRIEQICKILAHLNKKKKIKKTCITGIYVGVCEYEGVAGTREMSEMCAY